MLLKYQAYGFYYDLLCWHEDGDHDHEDLPVGPERFCLKKAIDDAFRAPLVIPRDYPYSVYNLKRVSIRIIGAPNVLKWAHVFK